MDAYPADVVLVEHRPRYNIAPTQDAPVVVSDGHRRFLAPFRWGLVPHWADDPAMGNRLINARAESVGSRSAFRDAWQAGRRCLVLADGFYEWRRPEDGGGPKQPYWIRRADRRPFGFAGLWERWGPRRDPLRSFTILTTDANELVRPVHDRMPVILDERGWERWIDPMATPEDVRDLLRPYASEALEAVPVSTLVNDSRNEEPGCIAPLPEA